MTRIAITLCTLLLLGGCATIQDNGASLRITIDSWDRIAFTSPEIRRDAAYRQHTKGEAERVIAKNSHLLSNTTEVMLSKRCRLDVDDIQQWLVDQHCIKIVFRRATSSCEPPVIRTYPAAEDTYCPNNKMHTIVSRASASPEV